MLVSALNGIITQITDHRFSYEVVVVDNDENQSANQVVKRFQKNSNLKVIYDFENEQNISLARNRCVKNAKGNLIAFIDDDEVPVKDWLYRLYDTIKKFNADGVLGPVLPSYPKSAPEWLRKGNIFDSRRFATGTQLSVRNTRTGNVLLKRYLFAEGTELFDPKFGRTGGEDVDFFGRHLAKGRKFIWCDEAVAYEMILSERWQIKFHLKKYLRIGTLNGERLRKKGVKGIMAVVKTLVTAPVWFTGMLLFFPFGKHLWVRPVLKLSYSAGCILAYCGFSLIRERD